MPDAPADDYLPRGTKHSQVVDRAEEVLLHLFADTKVQQAAERIAEFLLRARCVDTDDADHIVRHEADLWKILSEGALAWK